MMEKKEPIYPIDIDNLNAKISKFNYRAFCPSCKEYVENYTEICKCGQPLDWSKERAVYAYTNTGV